MFQQKYSSRRQTLKLIGGLIFGASITTDFSKKVLGQVNFPIDNIQPFSKMVQLVSVNPSRNPLVFTPALMLAIFWEETMFQNIKQWRGGPAVGFGQIEKSSIKLANQFVSGNSNSPFSTESILSDDNVSVQASVALLDRYFSMLKSKNAALMGYSGQRQGIVNKWLSCETALQSLLINAFGWNQISVEEALRKARIFPTSGSRYDAIHQKLWL
jgi:hypothetical protein